MPSRSFRRELSELLPSWQERGWISSDSAQALRTEYELDRPPTRVGSIVLGIFGTALLLGGIILILAHNWSELGRPLRGLISLLPLVITVALGHWVVRHRPNSSAWAETLGLANSLALCLAISLIAQTYHISGDLPRFLLVWALFTLGIALLLGSAVALTLFHVLMAIWAWHSDSPTTSLLGYWSAFALSLTFFNRKRWGACGEKGGRMTHLFIFLCACAALAAPLRHADSEVWLVLSFCPFLAATHLLADAPSRPFGGGVRWMAAIGLGIVLIFFSFEYPWTHMDFAFEGFHSSNTATLGAGIFTAVLHMALVAAVIFRRRDLDAAGWLWGATGLLGLVALLGQPSSGTGYAYMIGTNLFTAGLAVVTMILGIRKMNTLRTNLGWLLLSALIACRFFDSDLSFLVRGLAFIALGVGFLGLNLLLARLARRAAAAAAPTPPAIPTPAAPQA